MKLIVNKETIIGDILDYDETTSELLLEMGMHCLGCPSARGETLEEACNVHDILVEDMVTKLNNHISR